MQQRRFCTSRSPLASTILRFGFGCFVLRAFVRMHELTSVHADLAKQLDELEQKTDRPNFCLRGSRRKTVSEPYFNFVKNQSFQPDFFLRMISFSESKNASVPPIKPVEKNIQSHVFVESLFLSALP
jgi:hypothetical protein